MKSDYIYFGDAGLTSTSANHVANMAKESVKNLTDELSGVSFYGTRISLLSGGEPKQSKVGCTTEQLDTTYDSLAYIGEAHALIAWLREAIKARERLLGEVKDTTLARYCRDVLGGADVPQTDTDFETWIKERGYQKPDINGEFPELMDDTESRVKLKYGIIVNNPLEKFCTKFNLTMPKQPVKEEPMTADDYLASLTVKDRNRMLLLEAKAAVIGKFIHEDGKLAQERKALRHVAANPVGTTGEGQQTMLIEFTPSVSQEYVDGMFFRLAAEHRALQAELNGMLAERDRTIEADRQQKAAEYQRQSEDYSREMAALRDKLNNYLLEQRRRHSELQAEYNAFAAAQKERHQQLSADLEAWKLAEAKRIAGLGIVIPNELRTVYERVNGLGK